MLAGECACALQDSATRHAALAPTNCGTQRCCAPSTHAGLIVAALVARATAQFGPLNPTPSTPSSPSAVLPATPALSPPPTSSPPAQSSSIWSSLVGVLLQSMHTVCTGICVPVGYHYVPTLREQKVCRTVRVQHVFCTPRVGQCCRNPSPDWSEHHCQPDSPDLQRILNPCGQLHIQCHACLLCADWPRPFDRARLLRQPGASTDNCGGSQRYRGQSHHPQLHWEGWQR